VFHVIPQLLLPPEVARLTTLAGAMRFVDGRASNPDFARKKNLQPDHEDPQYKEASGIVLQAMMRNEYFHDYCIPRQVAPPMLTRYEPGMSYGEHVDAALIRYRPPLRIDVSCTVFISRPEDYEGGELVVRMGDRRLRCKEAPGAAIVYPATTFHEVTPVTRGTRLVAITFIESMVRDASRREILLELTEFLHEHAARVGPDAQMRLEYVRANLMRMWYED
jgi:PKHD-type hydroxylase